MTDVNDIRTRTRRPISRVTVVGDSVAASLGYVRGVRSILGSGLDVRLETAVCRRLTAAGCVYHGFRPPSALDVLEDHGQALGEAIVLHVGYNDDPDDYDIERVLSQLALLEATRVVWVTLREARENCTEINRLIKRFVHSTDEVIVADWEERSAGNDWFRSDGIHLKERGVYELALLIRDHLAD